MSSGWHPAETSGALAGRAADAMCLADRIRELEADAARWCRCHRCGQVSAGGDDRVGEQGALSSRDAEFDADGFRPGVRLKIADDTVASLGNRLRASQARLAEVAAAATRYLRHMDAQEGLLDDPQDDDVRACDKAGKCAAAEELRKVLTPGG